MTSQPDAPRAALEAARRRDRLVGLTLVVVTFATTMAFSWWAKHESAPELSEPPGPPTAEGVVGFPDRVEPIATLGAARSLTRRTQLRGIAMEGVRSDGTVSVAPGGGRVRYVFQSPPGDGPQPPRAVGELPRRPFCGKQNVHLKGEGLFADPDIADFPCPTTPLEDLPDPRCTARDVWARALEKGAPGDRAARVEYFRSKAGPAWRFDLPGSTHRFVLYGDCGRELTGGEASGIVP